MPYYRVPFFVRDENVDWRQAPAAALKHFQWRNNGFCPASFAKLAWTQEALAVRLWSWEAQPVATYTQHQSLVCLDSCLEFFVNFAPLETSRFFNFELNPRGVMMAAFGPPRTGRTPIDLTVWAEPMAIRARMLRGSFWGVEFRIPWALVQVFQPEFAPKAGAILLGNFYKCGENTPLPHYGMWKPIAVPAPDFHRPEFFAPLILEKGR